MFARQARLAQIADEPHPMDRRPAEPQVELCPSPPHRQISDLGGSGFRLVIDIPDDSSAGADHAGADLQPGRDGTGPMTQLC